MVLSAVRIDWRPHFWIAAVGTTFCLAAFLWVGLGIREDGERLRADREAVRAMWAGAELVRICGRGQEIYRIDGRLVTGVLGWSHPRQFAEDVTPEAACVR